MLKKVDLIIGQSYVKDKREYELTAIGLFFVLLMDHVKDEELPVYTDEFLQRYKEVKDVKVVTLYRYTYSTSGRNGIVAQSLWISSSFSDYNTFFAELLKTETKEVEI